MSYYRDPFGNPLTKKDVTMAVQAAVMNSTMTTLDLSRSTGLGIGKSARILRLLKDARIVSADDRVIQKGFNNHAGAVNAALRQLKKGKKQ